MKRIILSFILATAAFGVEAQISQGNFLLGGSVGFTSQTSKYISNGVTTPQGTTTTFTVIPQIGYLITDQLATGFGLNITSISYKASGSSTSLGSSQFLFSPFVRYYSPPKIYAQGGFDIGSASASSTGNGSSTTNSLSGWNFLLGYPAFLNESVALEPQIGISSLTNKTDASNKSMDTNFFIRIGIQIYIDRRN